MSKLLTGALLSLTCAVVLPLAAFSLNPAVVIAAEDPHEGGGGDHAEGVPLNPKTDLALWSLVVFVLFVIVLSKFAWGPLRDGLDNRESRIRNELAEAEAARHKAEQMLAEHAKKLDKVQDEVREIIAEARRDADHTKQDIIRTAEQEAETMRDRAVRDIGRARDQALGELFDAMSGRVADATELVLGRALSDDDQSRFINEALAQIGNGAK